MGGIVTKGGFFGCIILVAGMLWLGGCVPRELDLSAGERYSASGDWDLGARFFEEKLGENPNDTRLKLLLERTRYEASMAHLARGEVLLGESRWDAAAAAFRRSLDFDRNNAKARELLVKTDDARASDHYLKMGLKLMAAHRYYQSRDALKKAVAYNPDNRTALEALESFRKEEKGSLLGRLKLGSRAPISLKFKKTPIVSVFEILSKLSGINFIFDKDMKESRVTLFMTDVSFDRFLGVLLKTNALSARLVNDKTLLIYPDTPAKAKMYDALRIRTFYLANMQAKEAAALLSRVLKIKEVTANETLNTVVVRGTEDLMGIASKIIEANDRPPAEVLLNVQILEVTRNKSDKLGLETSDSVTLGIGETSTEVTKSDSTDTTLFAGQASLYSLDRLTNKELFLSLPTATLNILKTTGDTKTLAQPQIRVKHGEKASIHIGERVPLRSNRKVDSNNNVTYDFEYQDVGVKLLTEPLINLNDEVELKLHLEVSGIGINRGTKDDPQFGILTRTTSSVLTVRDGESIVIGGLIKDEERLDVRKIPLLGEMPVLGRLFSTNTDEGDNTDLFMTITPVIVRGQEIPGEEIVSMWSGTALGFSREEPYESTLRRKTAFREYPDQGYLMNLLEKTDAGEKKEGKKESGGVGESRKGGGGRGERGGAPAKIDSGGKSEKKPASKAGGVTEESGKGGAGQGAVAAGEERFTWPLNVRYSIQVNSFTGRKEADQRALTLSEAGYDSFRVETILPGIGRRFRVFVGAFDGYAKALKTCDKLKAEGTFADDIHVADRKWAHGE